MLSVLKITEACCGSRVEEKVSKPTAEAPESRCGCATTKESAAKTLPIIWQRLVNAEGETCPRCGVTQQELESAMLSLKVALGALGIEPTLEVKAIDPKSFAEKPTESNRVWIAGKPMEEWLDAKAGTSRCCSACGESECRTVEVGSTVYEAIPRNLLIKASLIAASQII
jgi:Domain of unknown function (DUF2703)